MTPLSVFSILLISSFLSHGEAIAVVEVADADKLSCADGETECQFFCCPYASGQCCWDGLACCPHGKTCIDLLGIGVCVGVEGSRNGSLTVTSERPAGQRSADCPSYTTACGDDQCCPLPRAVCCGDGRHCCPEGYACDGAGACVKAARVPALRQVRADVLRILHPVGDHQPKECPGGDRSCPGHTSCCLEDSGRWGCCPKPAAVVQPGHGLVSRENGF